MCGKKILMGKDLSGMELSDYLFSIELEDSRRFYFDLYSGKAVIGQSGIFNKNEEISAIVSAEEFLALIKTKNKNRLSINLNITNECNLNCPYCYFKASNYEEKIFTIDYIELLVWLDQILATHPEIYEIYFDFLGGEPLLKVNIIFELIDEIRKRYPYVNVRFTITSNGVFLSESISKQLALKQCESLQITIDGNEKLHNVLRSDINGKGSYRLILKNAQIASKYINIVIRVNFSEDIEIDIMRDMLRDIQDIDIKNVYFAPIEKTPMDIRKKECCNSNISKQMVEKYIDLWNLQKSMGFELCEHLPMICGICIAKNSNGVTINYDGKIYLCPSMCGIEEGYMGKISEEGLLLKKNVNVREECMNCMLFPICFGGCTYQEKIFDKTECRKKEKEFLLKNFFLIKYNLEVKK